MSASTVTGPTRPSHRRPRRCSPAAVLRRGGAAAGGQEEAVRQARGAARCRAVPRRWVRCRQDPPVGVDVTTRFLPPTPAPTAFATFGELTQLAGVFGFVECIELLADYVVVCIDEFELDDPGNTTLISRLLSQLVERGVSIAATSNTLPEQLGEGRFAAQDFLREINTLATIFTTVRIEGPGLPAPRPAARAGADVRRAGQRRPRRCPARPSTTSTRCARTWRPCTRRGI